LLNFILEWVACAVTLSGAALTSFNVYPLNTLVLELGSLLYIVWSIRVRRPSLILVNGVLFLIYLPGAYKALDKTLGLLLN
jgi:hypothetical protein